MSAYAEFAVTTNFSFLRGASHPEELVDRAKTLGLAGIGIADRNSVAGVVRAHQAAKEAGLKFAPGARLIFADGTPDILAYPQDRAAWGRLTRLLTLGKRRTEKGECLLYCDDLLAHVEGLSLIVLPGRLRKLVGVDNKLVDHNNPASFRGSAEGREPGNHNHRLRSMDSGFASASLRRPGMTHADTLVALLRRLREAAPRAVWLGASMLYRGDDARRLARLVTIASAARVPLMTTGDVLYHAPERRALQNVVTCIRKHTSLAAAGRMLEANAERHLKAPTEMARLCSSTRRKRSRRRCVFSNAAPSRSKSCATNIPTKPARALPRPRMRLSP
jgi:error-prone DNA polymerase